MDRDLVLESVLSKLLDVSGFRGERLSLESIVLAYNLTRKLKSAKAWDHEMFTRAVGLVAAGLNEGFELCARAQAAPIRERVFGAVKP